MNRRGEQYASRREWRQLDGLRQLREERDATDPGWREREAEAAAKHAAEKAARAAWIRSLPRELGGGFFVDYAAGAVVDGLGNFICRLPKTGSTVDEIISAADAALDCIE